MNSFTRLQLLGQGPRMAAWPPARNEWRHDEITVLRISLHSASCSGIKQSAPHLTGVSL